MSTRLGSLSLGAPTPAAAHNSDAPFPPPLDQWRSQRGSNQIPDPQEARSLSGSHAFPLFLFQPPAPKASADGPGGRARSRGATPAKGGRSTKSRFRVTCPMFSSLGQGHEEEEEEEPGPTVLGRCRPGPRPPPPGNPQPPGSPASLACTISDLQSPGRCVRGQGFSLARSLTTVTGDTMALAAASNPAPVCSSQDVACLRPAKPQTDR